MLRSLLAGSAPGAGIRHARIGADSVTDVVIGNAVGGGGNVARLAALEAGLPVSVPGVTVDRQCGSGLDAIVLASRLVAAGGGGIYLAGGVESISTAPLRAHRGATAHRSSSPAPSSRRLAHGDPDMGVAAENVAARFGISRERQDAFALRSHRRALSAAAAGVFEGETVPLPGPAAAGSGAGRATAPAPPGTPSAPTTAPARGSRRRCWRGSRPRSWRAVPSPRATPALTRTGPPPS